jgi:hypothetical protein
VLLQFLFTLSVTKRFSTKFAESKTVQYNMKFEGKTAVKMSMLFFWVVTSCGLVLYVRQLSGPLNWGSRGREPYISC